jgi:hypothetical protein
VRVLFEFLIPGVQNADKADLGSEVPGIGGNLNQRFRAGSEQQIVDNLLVLQSQRREFVWQRENDMRVACGQEFALSGGKPALACSCLTLRTVPVTARIEGDGPISAGRAFIDVTAESGGAAACDRSKHLQMGSREKAAIPVNELWSGCANDISHLQRWPWHLLLCRLARL